MPAVANDATGNAFYPPNHFGGCAARERQQHDASGIGSVRNEMRHAMSQCVGLTRACAGYDEEGWCPNGNRAAVFYSATLFKV